MAVYVEKDGPVTIVTLSRPEVRNAVDRESAEELAAVFRAFESDASARVGVLSGDQGQFCAGADLKKIAGGTPNRLDPDGDYWLMGRLDDVINVSGHRMGTAEVESALVSHPTVAEAAVVGFPHDIKGQGIYAFVTVNSGVEKTDQLKKDLVKHVRAEIGPIATPDKIHFADGLPKTRSGKIMRRILKKIAAGDVDNLGDTSTLAEPNVVDDLVDGRQ